MLSQTWRHPVVLDLGPLDWESSALTTMHCFIAHATGIFLYSLKTSENQVF